MVLSSIESYVGGQPAWERRTKTMAPNTNQVSVWVEEESQRNNMPHLPEQFSILTLTCGFNELSAGVGVTFTNRLWIEACELAYFRHTSTPVWLTLRPLICLLTQYISSAGIVGQCARRYYC